MKAKEDAKEVRHMSVGNRHYFPTAGVFVWRDSAVKVTQTHRHAHTYIYIYLDDVQIHPHCFAKNNK